MSYKPSIAPFRLEDLSRWVEGELQLIDSGVSQGRDLIGFTIHYEIPPKPQLAQLYYADGVSWNPGAGEGLYEYSSLGFSKLGGGDGNIVPTSHSVLQDLSADDHPQYHNDARGDARYYTRAEIDALIKSSFLELTDTPIDYVGSGGKVVAVKGDELGLEFIDPSGGSETFVELTDTPPDYIGQGGKGVNVRADELGLEFTEQATEFNIDGGSANEVYTLEQLINGGSA